MYGFWVSGSAGPRVQEHFQDHGVVEVKVWGQRTEIQVFHELESRFLKGDYIGEHYRGD